MEVGAKANVYRSILRVCLSLLVLATFSACQTASDTSVAFREDFESGSLDTTRWEVTSDGEFAESVVDVIDVDAGEETDYRLRLRAGTIGTSDPLKYLGVRSRDTIDFETVKTISFDLDWNDQANGCYLTASLYLCPTASNNPKDEDDWLKFEYVGVPPGRNVRINIWEKVDGMVHALHTDWGPRDKEDRPIGLPLGGEVRRITLHLDGAQLRVTQDDEEIYPLSAHALEFTTAYLYLQMSSGTNYPPREVYFDNVLAVSAPASD